MFRKLALTLIFALTLGVRADIAEAYTPPTPAPSVPRMGVTPTVNPEGVYILDATGAWVPLGGVNTTTHMFYPISNPLTPPIFGCVGDDITDDTACIQNAINQSITLGQPLIFDNVHLYKVTPPLALAGLVDLEGFAPVGNDGVANAQKCVSGLDASAAGSGNLLVATGERATIRNMCLQMAPVGSASSGGCAICLGGSDQQHDEISGNTIFRPYDGISFGGGSPPNLVRESVARDNVIRSPRHIGLSVGAGTTGGATVGITLVNNRIGCDSFDAAGVGFALFDGAVSWDGTNVGPNNCIINSEIVPGANQNVNGVFTGVMGDSAGTHGGANPMDLYIEPQSATGSIEWLTFTNIWAAGVLPSDTEVYIGNKNNGGCSNIKIVGSTMHAGVNNNGPAGNIVDIEGCINIVISGSSIDSWVNGATTNGILIHNGIGTQPGRIAITGNHIGNEPSATLTNGINIQTSGGGSLNPDYLSITGNEFGSTTNPIVQDITSNTLGILWNINSNEGVDDACPTVASAASVVIPGAATCIHLTGVTTVTTLNPVWQGRKLTVIADNGLTLSVAGGLPGFCANNIVIPTAGAAYLQFISNCWLHQ